MTNKDKGAIVLGAAITFCGLTLYAADRVLHFLFRDVDPDRIEKDDVDVIEEESEVQDEQVE